MYLALLFNFLLAALPADDRLAGEWTPLYYKNGESLNCHPRLSDTSLKVSFSQGVLKFHHCNHHSFYYTVEKNQLSIESMVSGAYTELYCTGGMLDLMESHMDKEKKVKFWLGNDTMVLFFKDGSTLELVRSDKFKKSWYNSYYKNKGCKWRWDASYLAKDSLDGEPVYRIVEIYAQLSGGEDPQSFVNANLVRTESMNKFKINGKVLVELLVDKRGKLHPYKILNSYGASCNVEIDRILKLMDAWEPAKIDDKAVNSRVILRFDYSIQK